MEPDEETAAGVKLIFELAQSGLGAKQIVRAMHERGIATPAEYKAAHGFNGHDISRCHGIWQESTVARILMDERYLLFIFQSPKYSRPLGLFTSTLI